MAQAYINWANGAYPLGTNERSQEQWDAIAAAFVAGWRARVPEPLGLRQPYDPNGHEVVEMGWEHECG